VHLNNGTTHQYNVDAAPEQQYNLGTAKVIIFL
jgi:hypothetical protein